MDPALHPLPLDPPPPQAKLTIRIRTDHKDQTFGCQTTSPPRPLSSQMGLDKGPPLPGISGPWGRCYLDAAALSLPYQVEEVGVASHGCLENLLQDSRVGFTCGFCSG